MNQILEHARKYHRRGWQPLPIAYGSKNPNFSGWQKFQTTEADLPNHFNVAAQNIGVLLHNGLTDVDLDSPEAVKIADYFLPPTDAVFGRASKMRSHRIFKCKGAAFEKFNNPFLVSSKDEKERKNACIVEIRTGNGLQTVFPGSTHSSGEVVEWHTDGEPLQVDAQNLRRAVALMASACLISTFWRGGVRQDLTMAVGGALLRNGFDVPQVKKFIKAICFAASDEETADRLKAVDATAQKLKSGKNVYGFPKLAELTDNKLVENVCKWLQIESRQDGEPVHQTDAPAEFTGEPKPLDLTLKPVEPLDDDCLPKVLVDWLRPASKVIGCPFDFLVLSAVIMVGSIIGSRLRVKPLRHSDWFVVPNLYGGCVGLPSTKKTPALDETRKPILELQAKARKEFSDKIKDFVIEAKCYERDTAAVYKEKLGLTETKGKINSLTEPNTPVLKRYETNDITTPKLAQFLSENPIGLLQNRDELVGWFKSLEADYDLNARSFILEVWKGAIAYELARVGNGEIQITSGTLSIIGGIQPSKLQRYISEAYSFDNSDGLPQRFLFAYPDTSKRSEKPTQPDYDAMRDGYSAVNRLCKKLAEFDFSGKVIGANGDIFQIVKFNAEAQAVVDEWQADTEAEAETLQVEDEAFSAYLYKMPKSCFAIALIFHCLEHINDAAFPDEMTIETTLRAIAYTEILITHARRVFALGENQIFSLAQILIGKIKKGELEQGFTAYEIKRKQWSGLKTPDTIKDVIVLLIDYGYLLELPTSGEPGRPTIKYAFHPSLETEKKDEVE
ncbi:MAG: DUF3987 domain-containing protein [Acidobacteria bacterium]|jgi:putative DNA primase/helicase|nr:DUF3987 domain-containing protein [Acidobacteriota bacterium]